jgi:hypothetical protein
MMFAIIVGLLVRFETNAPSNSASQTARQWRRQHERAIVSNDLVKV